MNSTVEEHRRHGASSLTLAVVTVSDTRTIDSDTSGALVVELAEQAGHRVADRAIVPDEPERMRPLLVSYRDRGDLHAVLLTGGTGISPRDLTYETVASLLTKPLPGYGELFRMLSYAEIGPACLLSRAIGGLMGELAVFVMPGSPGAVNLAMTRIILPELPHVVAQARKK